MSRTRSALEGALLSVFLLFMPACNRVRLADCDPKPPPPGMRRAFVQEVRPLHDDLPGPQHALPAAAASTIARVSSRKSSETA